MEVRRGNGLVGGSKGLDWWPWVRDILIGWGVIVIYACKLKTPPPPPPLPSPSPVEKEKDCMGLSGIWRKEVGNEHYETTWDGV